MPKGRPDRLVAHVRARLVELRQRRGWEEKDLIRASGFRQQDVNRFFTGQMVFPPLSFMDTLARKLDTSLAALLAELEPGGVGLRTGEQPLLDAWRLANEDDRKALWRLWLGDGTPAASGRRRAIPKTSKD